MSLRNNTFANDDELISVSATDYRQADFPFTNWSPHMVHIWGLDFPTAEHAYQYKKHADRNPELAEQIRRATNPKEAKTLAWSFPIDNQAWDKQRQSVMLEILTAKYAQHETIRTALSQTDLS